MKGPHASQSPSRNDWPKFGYELLGAWGYHSTCHHWIALIRWCPYRTHVSTLMYLSRLPKDFSTWSAGAQLRSGWHQLAPETEDIRAAPKSGGPSKENIEPKWAYLYGLLGMVTTLKSLKIPGQTEKYLSSCHRRTPSWSTKAAPRRGGVCSGKASSPCTNCHPGRESPRLCLIGRVRRLGSGPIATGACGR
jgi:hypothetical protein